MLIKELEALFRSRSSLLPIFPILALYKFITDFNSESRSNELNDLF